MITNPPAIPVFYLWMQVLRACVLLFFNPELILQELKKKKIENPVLRYLTTIIQRGCLQFK